MFPHLAESGHRGIPDAAVSQDVESHVSRFCPVMAASYHNPSINSISGRKRVGQFQRDVVSGPHGQATIDIELVYHTGDVYKTAVATLWNNVPNRGTEGVCPVLRCEPAKHL